MFNAGLLSQISSLLMTKLKQYQFLMIIILVFTLSNLLSVFGQTINSPQIYNPLHDTSSNKKILKIDYVIEGDLVRNSEAINKIQEVSKVDVGNQFSRFAIQQSIISLYALQEYSQIEVFILETTEGVELKYEIQRVLRIQNVNISGKLSDEVRKVMFNAIKIKPGDVYVNTVSSKDIDIIKGKCAEYGYFSAIVEADINITDEVITYSIDLGNPTTIKNIEVTGNTTVFTERINDIFKNQKGKIYQNKAVKAHINEVLELYRKKYYPSTVINAYFDPQTGLLKFTIDEGIQLLLDFVDDKGKPIFRDSALLNFLAKLRNRRVVSEKEQLRKEIILRINDESLWIQLVEAHFKSKGYHGTEVISEKLTNSPRHIKFIIKLGIRYIVKKVEFVGNQAFSDNDLLREMKSKPVDFFSGSFIRRFYSEQTLEKDTQRLKLLYEKAGYPDLSIKYELIKQDANNGKVGSVSIKFTIIEPYKQVIFRCVFSGNSVIDDDSLLQHLPERLPIPNARLLKKSYEFAILKAYQERGYVDAKIADTVYVQKSEKPVIVVEGNFSNLLDTGMIPMMLKDAFKNAKLQLSGIDIAAIYDTEWSMQDFGGNVRYTLRQEGQQLEVYEHGILIIDIEEGQQIEFGNFYFVGDTGVKSVVLNREVSHLSGRLFSYEKLNTAIRNLNSTGIFQTGIRWERYQQPILGSNPHTFNAENTHSKTSPQIRTDDVEIRLEKQKPGSYGTRLGYSSSDGPRGTIELSHRNLLKRNMLVRLRGRWGTLGYLYDTTLTEPWLIGRTSGSIQFLGRKLEEDDDVRALQGSFSLNRKLPRYHRLNLRYSYRYLKDTSEKTFGPKPSTTVSSLSFLWSQDSSYPKLYPIRGVSNEVTVEYAGRFLGGESSFIKTVTDTRYYRQLTNYGLVFATALRLGITTGLQTESGAELISFERFWAGGSTTVRGYQDRGLGPKDTTGKHRGNLQFIFNTELRFPIFDPIRGLLFFDAGNVWDSVQDIQYEWLPSSVGCGIRLHLGPLIGGVDYAYSLISVANVQKNSIYLRIGSTF